MPTNQTENYLRLHLLNNEAISVLRATFLKIVEETCDGDVDKFLREFEQDINKQLKNKAQLSILFPANRRTNIEQWDVSLVCFVLISCCTLEGKIRVDKLRDLMKRQYSAYNDIDKFLSYYKADIEQMKTDNAIDEVQYAKLYPNDLTSNLYEWDLNLLLGVLAKFCKGQNQETFRDILRNCIKRDVVLYATSPDLTEYLKLKEAKCKDIRERGLIEQGQYNQLFPQEGGISDVNKWDDHLLKVFVTTVCRGLTQNTLDAIKVVKQIRNELIAHKGSAEMETGEFLTTWTKLFNAIEVIVKEEVPRITEEWTQKCKTLNKDPFDITGAISILVEYYSKETSEFNSVRDALQDVQRTIEIGNVQRAEEHKRTQEQLLQLTKSHADLAEAMKNLAGEKKDMHRYTVTIDVESIEVKIHVASENESLKENTERAIRISIQSALQGRKTDIKIQTVSKLLEGFTKEGPKVESANSGSILLRIKCFSLKCITKLIVFVRSQELRKTLKEMEKEIGDDVELGCDISEESAQSLMKELARLKKKYDENNPLVCSRMETDNKKTSVQIAHEADDVDTETELVYFDTVDQSYTTEDMVLTKVDRTSNAKIPQLERIKTFDIKCPDDSDECIITSCTALPTGEFVLCDEGNDNIKLYDKHCTYRSLVRFPNFPFDSCMSDEDNTEVLVTVPDEELIYRVTVGDILKTRGVINVKKQCYGITCCALGIAVVVFDQDFEIQILRYNGSIVKRLYIALPRLKGITSIIKGTHLVISDERLMCLKSIDVHTEKVVFVYKDEDLNISGDLTSDSQDNIYIEHSLSNNVRILSSLGEKVCDILTEEDGLPGPTGLEYNQFNDTIMQQAYCVENKMCVYQFLK